MKRLMAGIFLGTLAAGVFMLLMIKWPEYFAFNMMLSAFCNKFLIGYVLGLCSFRSQHLWWGVLTGILVSLPETVAFQEGVVPIMVYGAVSGGFINVVLGRIK
jgi:hypothetical protein